MFTFSKHVGAPLVILGWVVFLCACDGAVSERTTNNKKTNTKTNNQPDPTNNLPIKSVPAIASMSRLTNAQYVNSIQRIFGPDLVFEIDLEVDETKTSFRSVGASRVGTSTVGVEQYRNTANAIADAVMKDREKHPRIAQCQPQSTSADLGCIRDIVQHYGRLLWRRSLTTAEAERYIDAIKQAEARAKINFDANAMQLAIKHTLSALIQSPHFAYVPYAGEPADASTHRYTSVEMASRLAFFLWNEGPDDALIKAGEAGELLSDDGLRAQLTRMLKDPRSKSVAYRFFEENWNIDDIDVFSKSAERFPMWSQAVLNDYRKEFRLVLDDVIFERNADVREVFTLDYSFINQNLASLYGIDGDFDQSFKRTPLPTTRTGLLTTGASLMANGTATRTSPTLRGVFVLEHLLCQHAPSPPGNVDDELPEVEMGEKISLRDQLEQHRAEVVCSGCHALFDPLGMTFEHFDGMGIYRTKDRGFDIDPSGDYYGRPLQDVHDVATLLVEDARTDACLVERFLSFATGHDIDKRDQKGFVIDLTEQYTANNHSFLTLVEGVVLSKAFRTLRPAEQDPPQIDPPDPIEDPPMEVFLLDEPFDGFDLGKDPDHWFDTKKDNSLAQNDNLFKTSGDAGGVSFGTTSGSINIHSHYVTDTSARWTNYELRGRMIRTKDDGGAGVTILSQYPKADAYYRLRAYKDQPLEISPHGTEVSGKCTSTLVPERNQWYRFRFSANAEGNATVLRAKIWPESQPEPGQWTIDDCQDATATRLIEGTVGLWSMIGPNYWDDLTVQQAQQKEMP